jgi:hypothetical protein
VLTRSYSVKRLVRYADARRSRSSQDGADRSSSQDADRSGSPVGARDSVKGKLVSLCLGWLTDICHRRWSGRG